MAKDGECTRLEISRVALEEDLPSQAYSFMLRAGTGVVPGGISVVETTDEHIRLAVLQSDRTLGTLRLDHGNNTFDSIRTRPEDENLTLEKVDCLAVSGCAGMVVTCGEGGEECDLRMLLQLSRTC